MIFKLLESFFFGPYPFLIAFVCILYAVIRRKCSDRLLWVGLGIWGIGLLATNGLVYALIASPLRGMIPPNTSEGADAIVTLGSSAQLMGAPTSGSAERAYVGAQVFEDQRAPHILLTGFSERDSLGSAKSMALIVLGMGVPKENILMAGGRNSYEEAVIGGRVLRQKDVQKIILVTSWYHIPRAKMVWEKQGFDVVTHTYFPGQTWRYFWSWGNLSRIRTVCHEYAGMLVYQLRGWI